MRYLVTGSSGHLGEALLRDLRARAADLVAIDIKAGATATHVGSIVDRDFVAGAMAGVDVVLHTAALHKPHIATHSRRQFVDINITGTLNLLEAAAAAGVGAFVFTSTTSTFGDAMAPRPDAPAAWITEDVVPQPKNIYGATKLAAESLCRLAHRNDGLNCLILRTSRFFPEGDDNKQVRDAYPNDNAKVNELLYRRADIEDIASAHFAAAARAAKIGFGCYIISATTPFTRADLADLRTDAPAAVRRHVSFDDIYSDLGWTMFPSIDRVYVNARARADLHWQPKHDFAAVLDRLRAGGAAMSALTTTIGRKGYHDIIYPDGVYPVE